MSTLTLPFVDGYCPSSHNCCKVCIYGVCELYFSYYTLVAFRDLQKRSADGFLCDDNLTICQNRWGNTTGKHLNAIDRDKNKRLPRAEFEKAVDRFLTKIGLKGE
jgi:hypothetical protein